MKLCSLLIAILIASVPLTFALELRLTYDANGNLVTGDGKFRTYNSLNQLSAVYNGSASNGTLLETYTYRGRLSRSGRLLVVVAGRSGCPAWLSDGECFSVFSYRARFSIVWRAKLRQAPGAARWGP